MKAQRYIQMPEQAWVPLHRAFKTECCDCHLVHAWRLVRRKGAFGFMIDRDNRATAQRRRKERTAAVAHVVGQVLSETKDAAWKEIERQHRSDIRRIGRLVG